jgi:hypothetical protein
MNELERRLTRLEAQQPGAPLVLTEELLGQAIMDLEEWDKQVDARAEEWERHLQSMGLTSQGLFPPDLRERHREARRQRARALQGTAL